MRSSRLLGQPTLPPKIAEPKNKKQQLRNDVISFLSNKELKWHGSEIPSSGEAFMKAMVDTLWQIDGQHDVFKSRNFPIPSCFDSFNGYNQPHLSKHRKRDRQNMSSTSLRVSADSLFGCLQGVYWEQRGWKEFKPNVEKLATSLSEYSDYLTKQCCATKRVHSSLQPVRQISENLSFCYLPLCATVAPCFHQLDVKLQEKDPFEYVSVEDVCPAEPHKKYEYVKKLKETGLSMRVAFLTYSHGNNIGSFHFVWRVLDSVDGDISESQRTIEKVKEQLPVFHTRAMKSALRSKFGRVTPNIKPVILRALYRELTADASAPTNLHEAEIDERMRMIIEMEDADIVLDLRHLNTGRKSQYDAFWSECKKFLDESVGRAVDDRRHGEVTHLAMAISVRDLRDQVQAQCPGETPIPCESWIRLQFWPKTQHAKSRVHYTGKLDVRFMVQARQFRKTHPDAHYAAALFRYQRELAVQFKDHSVFFSLDDKHRVKVGEPGFPVAAAERGRRVLVGHDSAFQVGDHDFTRMSIVPSVCFAINIPDSIDLSWYTGRVFVGLKEAIFEPSSPSRHIAELYDIVSTNTLEKNPIMLIYTDGGPDHRLTYLKVQLSLISLFLKLDLDFLCVCRTAPYHSWRNPVERVMLVLNLGLQSIGLMRKQAEEDLESIILKCNNMKQMRAAAEKEPTLVGAVRDSVEPVKILISDIIRRLQLKGRPFEVFSAASELEIEEVWNSLHAIDSTLNLRDKHQKGSLSSHPSLKAFLSHCCQERHYSFCVKKCGHSTCDICKAPRLPPEIFSQIHHLPDPIPACDGHYKSFNEIYGTPTTETHRPSSMKHAGKAKTLPFVASVQHVRNVSLMVQCEECAMWRLLYAPRKLSYVARQELESLLEDYTFSCGAALNDLDLPSVLSEVCARDLQCYDPVEKLYYSMNYDPICIYCCAEENLVTKDGYYPQCGSCQDRVLVKRRF